MPFNDTYANQLLDWTLGQRAVTLSQFSEVYIGLSTNDPEADGGVFEEFEGDTYERILIAKTNASYPDCIGNAANRSIQNTKQINWTKATVNWAADTGINGFGLFTAKTGGEPYFYGKLDDVLRVAAGSVALFDPGALKISFPTSDAAAAAVSD